METKKENLLSASQVFFSVLMGAMNVGQATPYVEAFSMARAAAATIFSIIDRVPEVEGKTDLLHWHSYYICSYILDRLLFH